MASDVHRTLPYPHDGWTPGRPGPRVVIESADPTLAWLMAETLRSEGFDVAECWGPSAYARGGCPLLTGDRCPIVEEADCIVRSAAFDRLSNSPILRQLRKRHPGTPICVESWASSRQEIDGCYVLGRLTPSTLTKAVNDLTRRGRKATTTA